MNRRSQSEKEVLPVLRERAVVPVERRDFYSINRVGEPTVKQRL